MEKEMEMVVKTRTLPPPSRPPECSTTSSGNNASWVAYGCHVTHTIPSDGGIPFPRRPTLTGAAGRSAVTARPNGESTDRPPRETEFKPVGEKLTTKGVELGDATMSNIVVNDACDEMGEIDEGGSETERDYLFEHVCAICDDGGDLL